MYLAPILILFLLASNLYALGENMQSFKADFIQTLKSQDNGSLSYQGNLEAKSPSKAKWNYTKPLKKEIFIDDKDVIVYEPNLYQATISHLKDKIDFLSILKSATLQENGKYLSKIGKTSYFLTLKDGKPFELEYEDEFENQIKIEFKNVLINTPIEDKDFVFVPPEGIDIIEQ